MTDDLRALDDGMSTINVPIGLFDAPALLSTLDGVIRSLLVGGGVEGADVAETLGRVRKATYDAIPEDFREGLSLS